jgi:LuxR family transcriptional regulator
MQPTSRPANLESYLAARDIADLWAQLHHDLEPYGIDRIFHGGSRRRPANGEHGKHDTLVLSSYGAEFDRFFVDGAGFLSDVTTQWALHSEGAVSWHLTARLKARGQLTARQLAVHEQSRALGVTAGYTVSLRTACTALVSGFGLCAEAGVSQARVDRTWLFHGPRILTALTAFDVCARNLSHAPPAEALSRRQREVLEWAGEGKTVDDIAEILELHRNTVAKHMHEARSLLGVATTLQAVLRAALQGQIYR